MQNKTILPQGVEKPAIKQTLLDAAYAAKQVTLPYFRSEMVVDNKEKDHFDPVTAADRKAEIAIRNVIGDNFPDHAIIGEEHANKEGNSDFSWIIDPIDGTRSFISGLPVWGTLIGVAHKGKLFAGLMAQPFIGELFLGIDGASTYQGDGDAERKLATSRESRLENARLFTTSPALFSTSQARAFGQLEQKARLTRYGCDCYAYCLLAAGHIDLVVEPDLKIYDIAALIPIIRFAGGKVTNFAGGPPDQGGDIIAAASAGLHAQAMEIMRP